uniref:Collagen alpha-5(VI) chain n=1 Tax=Ursus americanus TaxID=9643 RepID=A0A452STM3_URSAM
MKSLLIIFVLTLWTETLADQSPEPGPEYADVVFLVDSSDHLGTKSFPLVKAFIHKTVSGLPVDAHKYRVALAQYSDRLHSEFQLATFKSRNPMLNHLKKNFGFLGGSLRTGHALREAHRTFFSAPAGGRDKKQFPPILVVLASAQSEDDVEEASKALREDGVRIVSVGLQSASEEELKAMATARFHFNLRSARDLDAFSQNMTQIIKEATQYRDGAAPHSVDGKEGLGPMQAALRAPSSPAARVLLSVILACQKDSLADLIFLVDESVGTKQNLRNLQNFLRNIAASMDVRYNCTRLGLMSYSDRTNTISLLNSSTTQYEFQEQIQKLSVQAGKSNAGAAIEKMRLEAFSESSGSRRAQGVPQIAVLVTHRPSTDEVRDVAIQLRLQDVTVFGMNIQGADETQLEEIASYPPRQMVSMLKSYADLETYSKNFQKKLRNEIWSQISTRAEQMDLDRTGCIDTKEADIYFLIDGSTSIQGKHFEQIKEFMLAVTGMFSIGPDKVQVGAVQYSHKMRVEFYINDNSNNVNLKNAILNIEQLQGNTYTGEALNFMLSIIKEDKKHRTSQVPCYLIVLTDGRSADDVLEPAERLRAEQVTIHAVGIGEANKVQLQQIAGGEERVSFGQNFDSLRSIKNEVVHRICTEKGCEDMKADIMFLVDSSGSIGHENFGKMKTFMKSLLAKIQIGPDRTHIGVIQFSDKTREEFQLNKYFTQNEISDAIDRMSLIDENTLTGNALISVDQYFTPARGARIGVKKFLILITDGEAQDAVRDPAKALRDKGVVIFSVGVYGANRTQLEEISGDGNLVFQVENFDDLKTIESKLIFRVCTLHDCKNIKVLDIVFVLDHSGSINTQEQENMMALTIHLVKKADVGSDRVRIGALKYSDYPEILFHLGKYSNRSSVIEHLRRRRDTGGNTYTARALDHTNIMFTEEYGSRIQQNVKQMLIVITDGASHDRTLLNETALKLRNRGIDIYAVGVGPADQLELEAMAGNKSKTFHVDNFNKLEDIYLPLQESMCINAHEWCDIQEADVVFFCDGSDMVSNSEFVTMTTFVSELIDHFNIQNQKIKIGLAQFGSGFQKIIELKNSLTIPELKTQIQSIPKSKGFPRMDLALKKVKAMFDPSSGGRRNAGVPQTLVVITSGDPYYDVADEVKILRNLGICVLVWGIGNIHKEQLLPITGHSEKIVTLQDFNKLMNVDVKKRMVREICQSCGKTNCFMDIVVGFDISTHLRGQPLFHGHPRLRSYLPGILEDISSIGRVSCGAGSDVQVNVAFKVNNDREFPAKFQIYQKAIFDSLLQVTVNGPSHLNAQFLQSLWDTFKDQSKSQGQVLLIFSDGLGGESEIMLENQSDRLREAGLDALLVVSLNTTAHDEFSSFEFGKGFDYMTHLTIGMRELGKMLSQYLGNVAEKTCCCTFCKCSGTPGPYGSRGLQAAKVPFRCETHPGCLDLVGGTKAKGCTSQPSLDADEIASGIYFVRFLWCRSHCTPGVKGMGRTFDQQNNFILLLFMFAGTCPVYPTELVFALDQSYGISEQRFNEMREIVTSIVNDLNIKESNCPVGARVVVVSYDSGTSYLIRRSDYRNKKQLLQLISQIKYRPPTEARDVGNAMRFVARNVFKRTYAGANVRKVAVFFSNGQAASRSSIITATMEFSALDISPAVFALNERIFLEAFEFDNTGTFQVIPVSPNGEYEPLEKFQHCTLCYDKCFPNECIKEIFLPEDAYMDVAFLLDNSQTIANDEFKAVKTLVSSMIDNFKIASDPGISNFGDRIALLSYSPWDRSRKKKGVVKTEFGFTTFNDGVLMKRHIQSSLRQLEGETTIGHTLLWVVENLFPQTPNLRKHKVLFVISAGEYHERKEFLKKVALRAKCQGYVIVVISLGSTYKEDMEELASYPLDHHLIQLGRIHKPDLDYITKFIRPFVYSVRRGFNEYPPPVLENDCRLISRGEAYQNSDPLLTPEPHEISSGENSFIGQELSAGKDSSFLWEDNGSAHLVYVPSRVLTPQELTITYAQDWDSEEIASLTSGHENHGRKEEPGLTNEPGDTSLQEYYMDVAFLIDASQRIGNDEFKEVKAFLISVLDYFHIAPDPLTSMLGDRVAVLSYSPPGYMPNSEECPVYLEFDLVTYNSIHQMKHHLQDSFQQLNGDVFIGHALQWTIKNVFVGTPNLRKNKVIFVISAGETNPLDKEVLRNVALRAKCQGYSIFVFSFGPIHNDKELEELASHPLDHHLVQLGRTHKPDLNYITKFVKPFVHLIRRAINKYPPADLRPKCVNITSPNPENVGSGNNVFLIPEVYKIETGNSELFDEFGSQEQHSLVLGNNPSNGSETTTDLIQKLYMLFSTGELVMNDKEETHSEEMPALADGKLDKKDPEQDSEGFGH